MLYTFCMEKSSPTAKPKNLKPAAKKSALTKLKVRAAKKATGKNAAKDALLIITNRARKKNDIDQKMSKVEALHSAKKQTPPISLSKKPSAQLSLWSPAALPLDGERIAAQTARYGGLTLVAAGASLALLYVQLVELPMAAISQLSSVCTASDITCLLEEQSSIAAATIESTNQEVLKEETALEEVAARKTTETTTAVVVNKLPAVFTVGSPEPLKGVVPVNVTVAEAESVVLSVYYEDWNKNLTLGSARKEAGAWVYQWDTSKFENGRYKLKALIKNSTGTYEQVSDKMLTVKNAAEKLSTAVAAADEESEQRVIEPTPEVALKVSLNSAGTHMTVSRVYPEITSSDVVKVYLISAADDSSRFVDDSYLFTQAYLKTNVTWKHTFDVSNFSAGEYRIRAERWRGDTQLDVSSGSVTLRGTAVSAEAQPVKQVQSNAVISVRNASDLQGFVDVHLEATDANFAEIYAVNTASTNNLFLGLARKSSNGLWVFNWDTRQLPNSRYHVFAKVGSSKGTYESNRIVVTIQNDPIASPTPSQVLELSERTEKYEELLTDNVVVRNNFWNVTTATTTAPKLNEFIEQNKDRLQEEFQRFAAALRSGNEASLTAANTRLIGLENEFRDFVDGEDNFDDLMAAYNEYISTARTRIETDVQKIEQIILERDAEGLFSDTDWDGVTDFDELYIYKTDPFSADTNRNGIPDGVAILNGLDPRADDLKASIAFESPEDIGIIRNDLLRVESVTAVTPDIGTSPEVTTLAPAIIAGTALPNSYVTIFIFSTPVIVTVRTEADGSWQYRFEKEMEDGEHTVYVALTDNAGRIIARSSPFRFIKEAQAYTTIDAALADYDGEAVVKNDYTFFSSSIIYLVMSFAVVTVGLVLLLLGMYIDKRRRQDAETGSSSVLAV